MIVQSNALCSGLLRDSCRLSATRPERLFANTIVTPRRAYATRIPSNYRRDTILQDSGQAPACTCWSLLSPSSSVIASNLPTLKLRKARLTSGKTPLLVLLVTPAHIRLLDGGSAFIPSLLQSALANRKPWQEFDLLAAVVDRIPQRSSTASHSSEGSHAADADASPTTRVEDGSEGISVAVLDSEAAAPDLWSLKDTSSERGTMTIQQRCTLSFSLPPNPGIRTQFSEKSMSQPLVERMLQLPVANTVFQNGRTSTLFAQKWVVSFRSESTSEHLSSEKTWLPQQTVHMDAIFADEGMRLQLDTLVHSRLVPITPTRTVNAAVGNIVRKISGSDASAKAVPASEELERAICTAIEQNQISAQQPGVWALIRPQKYVALDRPAQLQGTVRDIGYAVLSGARLHRVLSGGGGWGEKQGLLALDPDSDYSHHHQPIRSSLEKSQEAEVENYGALREVAKLEDMITFYGYSSPSDAGSPNLGAPVFWSSNPAITATLIFGSLPSTMDAMHKDDIAEADDDAHYELIVEENNFGMLSEQGMSLESSFLNTNIPAARMQYLRTEAHRQIYDVRRRNTVTTKLDAPYTTFTIRGRTSRIPITSEVKQEGLQALNVHLQDLMPPESSTATAATKPATIKPAAALVQKLPKTINLNQEAQQSARQEDAEAGRVLIRLHPVTVQKDQRITSLERTVREERRARRLKESQAQSRMANERSRRITEEANAMIQRHPGTSQSMAWEVAKRIVKEAVKQEAQAQYMLQVLANKRAQIAKSEHSVEGEALTLHQNIRDSGKIDDDPAPRFRFTYQEREIDRKIRLQSEAHGASPVDVRRHFCVSPGDLDQEQKLGSVQIIKEESEGKIPGTVFDGKGATTFMMRKHFTRNPFERFTDIQRIGEISSREQAMGLHSQYHLGLDEEPEERRGS